MATQTIVREKIGQVKIEGAETLRRSQVTLLLLAIATGLISALFFANTYIGNIGVSTQESALIGVSGTFVTLSLFLALWLAQKTRKKNPVRSAPTVRSLSAPLLNTNIEIDKMLIGEFEYARETATQAKEERRTVINFYLLIFGGGGSVIIALLSNLTAHSYLLVGATALLWIVSLIGGLFLLKIIALRWAWVGSAAAMNFVKEFFIKNTKEYIPPEDNPMKLILESAFLWSAESIPPAKARWNVDHYSAILIAMLDAVAFIGGVALLAIEFSIKDLSITMIAACVLGFIFYFSHLLVYDIGLSPKG